MISKVLSLFNKYKWYALAVAAAFALWKAYDFGYQSAEIIFTKEKNAAVEAALAKQGEAFEKEMLKTQKYFDIQLENAEAREKIVYKYRDRVREVTKYVEKNSDSRCLVRDDDGLQLLRNAIRNADSPDTDTRSVPDGTDNPGSGGRPSD